MTKVLLFCALMGIAIFCAATFLISYNDKVNNENVKALKDKAFDMSVKAVEKLSLLDTTLKNTTILRSHANDLYEDYIKVDELDTKLILELLDNANKSYDHAIYMKKLGDQEKSLGLTKYALGCNAMSRKSWSLAESQFNMAYVNYDASIPYYGLSIMRLNDADADYREIARALSKH